MQFIRWSDACKIRPSWTLYSVAGLDTRGLDEALDHLAQMEGSRYSVIEIQEPAGTWRLLARFECENDALMFRMLA